MRLFLTIDAHLLDLNSAQFKKLKVSLKKKDIEHRWLPQQQLHIPILSLGEVGRDAMLGLDQIIRGISSGHSPFDIKLQGIWGYPEQAEARILWVQVQNTRELRFLEEELVNALNPEEEIKRLFLPIVRFRNHKNVTDLISPYKNADFGTLKVEKLILYEMTSGGPFPTYRPINTYELSDTPEASVSL